MVAPDVNLAWPQASALRGFPLAEKQPQRPVLTSRRKFLDHNSMTLLDGTRLLPGIGSVSLVVGIVRKTDTTASGFTTYGISTGDLAVLYADFSNHVNKT